ncbi:MAG: tRNA 2-thiouridine(34) synthase MnmA [Verrucomicrobiota bacterium]
MAKILVGLSGGVDSSVAAGLLVREGHEVVGAYMKNWINEENILGHCPWKEDIEDARAVADALGIEFRIVNLMKEYRERVVKYLLDGYTSGITPNPDCMCNREMKFGVFLDYALAAGFEFVATGHYARVDHSGAVSRVFRGMDPNKDQTYFLALMRQEQVKHALFPIGEMEKPRVRELAAEFSLPTASKKDSQGICFIGEVKMQDFLDNFVEERPGRIVNTDGKVLGEHRGLHLFTLGQRRGIGVASNTFKEAFVVVDKRGETNELVVAFDRPDSPLLYATECILSGLSFTGHEIPEARTIHAQPRYRTEAPLADFEPTGGGGARLVYHAPQRALTPGQICAFYDRDELLGGAIFERIAHPEHVLA